MRSSAGRVSTRTRYPRRSSRFGINVPRPGTEVLSGLSDVLPLLVTAIPLGIYNFTEGMNNVESASVAGDNYNLRHVLLADGIGAIVGSFLGSPFPPAVYIGHPGWKAVGGRIGYSLATGLVISAICLLGSSRCSSRSFRGPRCSRSSCSSVS